jgi:hypothetical protein
MWIINIYPRAEYEYYFYVLDHNIYVEYEK